MAPTSRSISLLIALCIVGAGSARAQVLPIPRAPDTKQEARQFNAESLRDVSGMLAEWRGAWARNDARGTARFYTEDALLAIGEEKPFQGRQAIESGIPEILATTGVVQVAVDDFAASGNIAYAFGSFWYQNEAGVESGTQGRYVMVFRRDGRTWRIRSQVFNAAPAPVVAPATVGDSVGAEDETGAGAAP